MVIKRICLNCTKYIFDGENVDGHKKMTAAEYVSGIVNRAKKTNHSPERQALEAKILTTWFVSKSECELCGAPHAVISDHKDAVVEVRFFYSGGDWPDETDRQFIEDFRDKFIAR